MTAVNICADMNMTENCSVAQMCQRSTVMPVSENNSALFGTSYGVPFFAIFRIFGFAFYSFRLYFKSSTANCKPCKKNTLLQTV